MPMAGLHNLQRNCSVTEKEIRGSLSTLSKEDSSCGVLEERKSLSVNMGPGYVFGATPAVESASSRVNLSNFLEGAPSEVANSNSETLTLLSFSSTIDFFS
jgi:hypothetical protein